ncbi:MAG: helix-turn-helix transcriptional regulator [Thermoleophilaceae bacterium]
MPSNASLSVSLTCPVPGAGAFSPVICPWRSDLALSLAALDRGDEALALTREELELAERAEVERGRGGALRANGLIEGGAEGIEHLEQAVAAYERSQARLEHARALCDLGAALRRANRRRDGRERLELAHELALACGGRAVQERAAAELEAAGSPPRRDTAARRDELTPSERRVAEMAAEGMSNPHIAQALFVTLKTIETHLSACYRKLGIRSRAELPAALGGGASG